jgi:DNA-binding transcriptional LysR family regulator
MADQSADDERISERKVLGLGRAFDRNLRFVIVLARRVTDEPAGAFADVAAELGVSVQNLRRALRALEDELGSPLLKGRGAKLSVTRLGVDLLELATGFYDGVNALRERARKNESTIAISSSGNIAVDVLPQALERLRIDHPDLAVRIRREGSLDAMETLRRGDIDVALIRAARAPVGFGAERLTEEQLWVVGRKADASRLRMRPLSAALSGATIIAPPPGFTHTRISKVIGKWGGHVHIAVEGRELVLKYVASGFGLGFISLVASHKPPSNDPSLFCEDVTKYFERVYFWAVYRKRSKNIKMVGELVNDLREVAREVSGVP